MAFVTLDDLRAKGSKVKYSTGGRQTFKKAYLEDDVYDPGRTLRGEDTDDDDDLLEEVTKSTLQHEVKELRKEDKRAVQATEPPLTKSEASPPKDSIWAAFLERRQKRHVGLTKEAHTTMRVSKRKRGDLSSSAKSYGASPVTAEDTTGESTEKNERIVKKETRKLSQEVLHMSDGTKSGPDERILRGAKRSKRDE